jgi:hypothetical protein
MPDYQPHTVRQTAEYSAPTFKENSAPFDNVVRVAIAAATLTLVEVGADREIAVMREPTRRLVRS